jgi:hypothetical protein
VLLGELALRHVAGVGLAENGVSVSRNDLAVLESGPEVVLDGLVTEVVTDSLLHLLEPDKHLLVSQSVEGTSETVETGSQGQVRGAESGTDQVSGVGTDVATLVISVDSEVQAHQLNEVLVLGETELVGQVERVVLVLLDRSDLAVLVDVAVDLSGEGGELGDEVHGVLESVLPVLRLGHTLGVGLCEAGLVLESSDGEGELGHWVEVARAAVDELLDELGDVGTGSPLSGEVADLLLGGDLAGQKKPEETFRERLLATGGLGKELLAFGDLSCVSRGSAMLLIVPPHTVLPRKRIPSSESRTDPSQTRDLMPRAPP